ncbi:ribose-5-phosphate isomerase RpiA [Chloroflexota bacterium]
MDYKREAARQALDLVQSGMLLGLGTGSTVAPFLDLLGDRLRSGELRDISGVPTSQGTAARAQALGIPLASLADHARLDLAVDGADEVDSGLNLIKGLGRALLREKVVEIHCDRFVVVVDESKLVRRLGSTVPLPVEMTTFSERAHLRWLNTLGCLAEQWLEEDGSPVVTDNGNYLALCRFPDGIDDAYGLARALADRPGIIEHGLFLDMATSVIVAGPGGTRTLERR